MQEFRIHGRGGQGVLTVGQLIAEAFFSQGNHVQTFATYGGERRGAPVTAFIRVDAGRIHRRCDVEHPSLVLLFEPTFAQDGTGLAGLLPGATIILNTTRGPEHFSDLGPYRIATLDALAIARSNGLNRLVNTAMLGAFCRVAGLVSLPEMEAVVRAHAPYKVEENLEALRQAYASVKFSGEVATLA